MLDILIGVVSAGVVVASYCAALTYGKSIGYIKRDNETKENDLKQATVYITSLEQQIQELTNQVESIQAEERRQPRAESNGWDAFNVRR